MSLRLGSVFCVTISLMQRLVRKTIFLNNLKLIKNNFLDQIGEKRLAGLSAYELKVIQRILLEMLCQYELSSHFRTLPPEETHKSYYEIVRK